MAAVDSQVTSNQFFWFRPILKSSQIPRGCGGRKQHRPFLSLCCEESQLFCIRYSKSPQARREQAPCRLCWFVSEMSPTGSWLGRLCYFGSVESLEMGAWLLNVNTQDRPLQLMCGSQSMPRSLLSSLLQYEQSLPLTPALRNLSAPHAFPTLMA